MMMMMKIMIMHKHTYVHTYDHIGKHMCTYEEKRPHSTFVPHGARKPHLLKGSAQLAEVAAALQAELVWRALCSSSMGFIVASERVFMMAF